MQSVLGRAIQGTHLSLNLSPGTIIRSILVPLALVGCLFFLRGKSAAVSEVTEIVILVVAFALLTILPTFLWHLWLTPYKLMGERLDQAIDDRMVVDAPQQIPPSHANAAWSNVELLTLEQSACLWVGLEPHSPITDRNAKAALSQLKGAVKTGQLKCNWNNGLQALQDFFRGGDTLWPVEQQAISIVSLAVYVHGTNQVVPKFLENVDLPEEPMEDRSC